MHHFKYGITYANMVVLGTQSPPTTHCSPAKLSCLVPLPPALRQVSLGIRMIMVVLLQKPTMEMENHPVDSGSFPHKPV